MNGDFPQQLRTSVAIRLNQKKIDISRGLVYTLSNAKMLKRQFPEKEGVTLEKENGAT